ncbi:MAG TPA: transcription repressor NadR [Firmicutes bacterium]|nr:transcription repressor NadR [Candidatus Fermentithermobacillaceae bacterium]
MNSEERRRKIMEILTQAGEPVTGSTLASNLKVSRQVIVQDIALLRAQGQKILATPGGYTVLEAEPAAGGIVKLVAVKHGRSETQDELYTMVDSGAEVIDVTVDHPVYGQLTGQLSLKTRSDVDRFIRTMEESGAGLLSSLTGGVHLHTVRVPDLETFERLGGALRSKGFLLYD